jgi:hypothetical protein
MPGGLGPGDERKRSVRWLMMLLISTAASITPTRVGLVAKRRGRSPTDVYNDVYTFEVKWCLTCAPSGFRTPDPLIKRCQIR